MNSEFLSQLYEAAENPEKWAQVLSSLARSCGAVAAIITLRSARNAQVVISEKMAHELHTPYIAGLSREVVSEYVAELIEKDIWARTQARIHPHVPTVMSRHLPFKELRKSELWPWLEAQSINDTVVVEIGHSKNYWTALNLFFWNSGDDQAQKILDFTNLHLQEIKRAWTLSRNTMQLVALKEQLISHVKNSREIIFLLDEQNNIVARSASTNDVIEKDVIRVPTEKNGLSVVEDIETIAPLSPDISKHKTKVQSLKQYQICGENPERFSMQTGETIGLRTIVIVPTDGECFPWEHPNLDEREKLAVRILISRGRVKDIATELGVSERYARTIWRNIRDKLNNPAKHELIIKYRSVLEANMPINRNK